MGHVIVIAVLLLAFFFNVVFFSFPKVLGTICVSITDLPTSKIRFLAETFDEF